MEIGRQLLRHLLRMHDMPLRCAEHGEKTHRILQRFLDAALTSIQADSVSADATSPMSSMS